MDKKVIISMENAKKAVSMINGRKGKNGGLSIKGVRKAVNLLRKSTSYFDKYDLAEVRGAMERDFTLPISVSDIGTTSIDHTGDSINGTTDEIFVLNYQPLVRIIS